MHNEDIGTVEKNVFVIYMTGKSFSYNILWGLINLQEKDKN